MIRTTRVLLASDAALFLFATLVLLWPVIVNGRPLYYYDSETYLRGGGVGFRAAVLIVNEWRASAFPAPTAISAAPAGGASAIVAAAMGESRGARSVSYSLATYLLRAPGDSLALLAIAQAATVAFLMLRVQRLMAARAGVQARFATAAAIALLTTACWYASTALPDIFAGIAILTAVALTLHADRLKALERIAILLLLAFAMTVHASHVPLAAVVIGAGAAAHFWLRRPPIGTAIRQAAWFAAPLLIGLSALYVVSYVGFGETSVAPKRYPISLARSVADGPGLWHLRAHCATERYAVCEVFGDDIPTDVDDFLWKPNGLRDRATPAQMERIRAEEFVIIDRAAREYPMFQLWRSGLNFVTQLWKMGLNQLRFGLAMQRAPGGEISLAAVAPDRPWLRRAAEVAGYVVFFGSLAFALLVRRRLTRAELAALLIVVVGLVANAAICGVLSAPVDRYQGRVAWVLPLIVSATWLRLRAGSGGLESN